MNAADARRILALPQDEGEPAALPVSVLSKLTIADVPEGTSFHVGTMKDGVLHLDWDGTLYREGGIIVGEADYTRTRKYWYSPLGLEQYLDLVRRAVETRHRVRGDVALSHYDDDGAYVALYFRIDTTEHNLARAYEAVRKVTAEVEGTAEEAAAGRSAHCGSCRSPVGLGFGKPRWARRCGRDRYVHR